MIHAFPWVAFVSGGKTLARNVRFLQLVNSTNTVQGFASILWTCLNFHPSMQNTCTCMYLHIPGISFMSIRLTVSLNPERPGWTFRISACLRSISWWTTLTEKSAWSWTKCHIWLIETVEHTCFCFLMILEKWVYGILGLSSHWEGWPITLSLKYLLTIKQTSINVAPSYSLM